MINISITQQIGNTQFTNISSIYPNPVPLAKASPVSTLIIPLKKKAKNKQPNESIFSKIRLNKVVCLFLEWKEDSENNRKTSADS